MARHLRVQQMEVMESGGRIPGLAETLWEQRKYLRTWIGCLKAGPQRVGVQWHPPMRGPIDDDLTDNVSLNMKS